VLYFICYLVFATLNKIGFEDGDGAQRMIEYI